MHTLGRIWHNKKNLHDFVSIYHCRYKKVYNKGVSDVTRVLVLFRFSQLEFSFKIHITYILSIKFKNILFK